MSSKLADNFVSFLVTADIAQFHVNHSRIENDNAFTLKLIGPPVKTHRVRGMTGSRTDGISMGYVPLRDSQPPLDGFSVVFIVAVVGKVLANRIIRPLEIERREFCKILCTCIYSTGAQLLLEVQHRQAE